MDSCMDESRNNSDFKSCMNFKWTDELTLRFILLRHERRNLFTKKRNTSRYGWQQILSDMGLSMYVTPYQAQKKWNNLWSKYKLAKRAQEDGTIDEDPNSSWPFFTVLDAIASGKAVTLASPLLGNMSSGTVAGTGMQTTPLPSFSIASSVNAPNISTMDASKQGKSMEHNKNDGDEESNDPQQHIVELLQANLHQLDEIKCTIETQGQTIAGLLSQLLHVLTGGVKEESSSNRIDQAISATIHEIGIPQDSIE